MGTAHLRDAGAASLQRDPEYPDTNELIRRNREWLEEEAGGDSDAGSYLCGETSILLMAYGREPSEALTDAWRRSSRTTSRTRRAS